MKSFALSLFVVVALAVACHADKKCNVVCPDYDWPLDKPIVDNILGYFQRDTPEDGVCTGGRAKYIFYGRDFGFDYNRCVCLTTPVSQYKSCGEGIPQCPQMLTAYVDETTGDFFKRIGKDLSDGPSDGCCPPGSVTWISEPQYTGVDRNLCFCVSQSNLDLE
jgi:hypothetical protein